MYIRLKKRLSKKGVSDYAYEAKNIRTKKGPRQKVVSYLGKVHPLENNNLILTFYLSTDDIQSYFEKKRLSDVVKELLIFELIRHGFSKTNDILIKGDFTVNIDDKTVKYSGVENIVLSLNKGYLCSKTLKKCFKDIENASETQQLIKSLLLIGLNPNEDTFTKIFSGKI
ncbi:MAG TPA: hypothetical protein VJH20_00340 [Candidatus Nanoarchaeia archaeon]|nr:hypothetical protein [Candidatus Nanoarchaeia archaeon]